jgi:hypothetical protein
MGSPRLGERRSHDGRRRERIAAAIKTWRLREPVITYRKISDACGVCHQTVWGWANGHSTPKVRDLEAMEVLRPGLIAMVFPEVASASGATHDSSMKASDLKTG